MKLIHSTIPTLPAADLDQTIAFYAQLGFPLVSRYEEYAIVARDGIELHFYLHKELDAAENPSGMYVRTPDVAGLFKEFTGRGVKTLTALEDKEWGQREFAVADPSGNLLRFGQPTRK